MNRTRRPRAPSRPQEPDTTRPASGLLPLCERCGRVSFPSRADAEHALMEARLMRALYPHNTRRREERTYLCTGGDVYHLAAPRPN